MKVKYFSSTRYSSFHGRRCPESVDHCPAAPFLFTQRAPNLEIRGESHCLHTRDCAKFAGRIIHIPRILVCYQDAVWKTYIREKRYTEKQINYVTTHAWNLKRILVAYVANDYLNTYVTNYQYDFQSFDS